MVRRSQRYAARKVRKRKQAKEEEEAEEEVKEEEKEEEAEEAEKSEEAEEGEGEEGEEGEGDGEEEGEESDSDEGYEEDSDSEEEEEELPPKILPKRTTRGQRANDRAAVDEAYAKLGFQGEEEEGESSEEDEGYTTESQSADEVDSDFDVSSSEEDETMEVEVEKTKKKRGAYVDPVVMKRTSQAAAKAVAKTVKTKAVKQAKAAKEETKKPSRAAKTPAPKIPPRTRMSLRKSTRAMSARKAAERKRREDIQKARPKRKRAPVKVLSQKELLEEAKQTEVDNRESLRMLVELEEEKKKFVVKKRKVEGPAILYHSKNGRNVIALRDVEPISLFPPQKPTVLVPASVCVATRRPAKYKDPRTGYPFASVMAFKHIRAHQR